MLVQKLRLQRGWSQQQLADLSGLSVRTIQRIERGQGASIESLKSLAAVFETDFSNLIVEPAMNLNSNLNTDLTADAEAKQGTPIDELLAMQHVQRVKRFYMHVIQYVIVMSALAAFNLIQTPGHIWFVWPLFGWGIGILSHAATTFQLIPIFDAEWEKQQVEKRLGRPL